MFSIQQSYQPSHKEMVRGEGGGGGGGREGEPRLVFNSLVRVLHVILCTLLVLIKVALYFPCSSCALYDTILLSTIQATSH